MSLISTEMTDDEDRAANRRVLSLGEEAREHEGTLVGTLTREKDFVGGWREDGRENRPEEVVVWVLALDRSFELGLPSPLPERDAPRKGTYDEMAELARKLAVNWVQWLRYRERKQGRR